MEDDTMNPVAPSDENLQAEEVATEETPATEEVAEEVAEVPAEEAAVATEEVEEEAGEQPMAA